MTTEQELRAEIERLRAENAKLEAERDEALGNGAPPLAPPGRKKSRGWCRRCRASRWWVLRKFSRCSTQGPIQIRCGRANANRCRTVRLAAMSFHVSIVPAVRSRLRRLAAAVQAAGMNEELSSVIEDLNERLVNRPLEAGEPQFMLAATGLVPC